MPFKGSMKISEKSQNTSSCAGTHAQLRHPHVGDLLHLRNPPQKRIILPA